MKRAIGLILIISACVVGFLSIGGNTPFMPISGSSMEPTLQSGSLLIIKPIEVTEIREGNIIVYNVPRLFREYYNYPPIIAHRVIEVRKDQLGLWLQTKGDNTSEDPFFVRAQNIKGTVGDQIPYLGLPLLFLQNRWGTILVVIAIVLLAIFLYFEELSLGIGRLVRTVLSPVIEENYRANLVMTMRFEATERALDSFASAMQVYSEHLASHTSAIQGLSEASQALKGSAAEQNNILARLTKTLGQERSEREVSRVARVVDELEKRTLEALQAKYELEKTIPIPEIKPHEEPLLRVKVQSPPGCTVNPKALLARTHYIAS